MSKQSDGPLQAEISTLEDLSELADYSFIKTLNCDPEAKKNGIDHIPRQVFSGHYVPVNPTPIKDPEYITHSKIFFNELGFNDEMAKSEDFIRMFSGDLSHAPRSLSKIGWACGYALSIYGSEYYQQCPFQTGNGYGDGRAVSILEAVIRGQRLEMQLKGGGPTPYCRGGDGRAVLRSSVREFLAQEHMHELGIPTSRSLCLYVSKTEKVKRPWYSSGSQSLNPDILITEAVAISTRVAPSFIRVGQLELFGRRARKNEHGTAMEELKMIVLHLIDIHYSEVIEKNLSVAEKVLVLAREFCKRLTTLVANWIRVGFCQGNFNSDNCAAGGFTLDYGPFGFCEVYNPEFQPWTGGGIHYSFLNQPVAAEKNFQMFCLALKPLLASQEELLREFEDIENSYSMIMQKEMEKMWALKLGLLKFHSELFEELELLMIQTPVDYTIFFRELSSLPENINSLKMSFYNQSDINGSDKRWAEWLIKWRSLINLDQTRSNDEISKAMKLINPKYILREWFLVPAYQQAAIGDYSFVRELQEVMTKPYAEQSREIEEKYYKIKPSEYLKVGGLSYYSCSS